MKVPSPIQYWDVMFPYTESYCYGKIEEIKTNLLLLVSDYLDIWNYRNNNNDNRKKTFFHKEKGEKILQNMKKW